MNDEIRICRDCKEEFSYTDGEIKFYEANQLILSARCKRCRQAKKASYASRESSFNHYDK
jgi:hypothetical protein